jgi:chromosome segregation ATPase
VLPLHLHQADQFLRKVEVEKQRIIEMTKQIAETQETIMKLRREMGSVNSMSDVNAKVQKEVHLQENKLDKALIKLNEALKHNKQLREQIEALRRERQVFDGVYKKLELELREKKREMASIVDLYNEAYRRRDECYAEMAELKTKADEEQVEFEAEWRRLSLIVEEDRRKTALMSPTMAQKLGATQAAATGASASAEGAEGSGEGGPPNAGAPPLPHMSSQAGALPGPLSQRRPPRRYVVPPPAVGIWLTDHHCAFQTRPAMATS